MFIVIPPLSISFAAPAGGGVVLIPIFPVSPSIYNLTVDLVQSNKLSFVAEF